MFIFLINNKSKTNKYLSLYECSSYSSVTKYVIMLSVKINRGVSVNEWT